MSARRLLLLGSIASASAVGLVLACGPGDLHYLMAGSGATQGDENDGGAVDTCKHALPPPAPSTGASNTVGTLIFAAQKMRIDSDPSSDGTAQLSSPQGVDLDRTCSYCAGSGKTPSSCTPPSGATVACDTDGGRDNVAGPLLHSLTSLPAPGGANPFKEDILTSNILKGYFTLLTVLTGWNGTDDDPNVSVFLYMSGGMRDDGAQPQFNGQDVWNLDAQSVLDGDHQLGQDCSGGPAAAGILKCLAVATDAKAYVANGKLVAQFESIPFSFGDNAHKVAIPMAGVVLQGALKQDSLDAEISGRWLATDILSAAANIYFDPNTSICNNPTIFSTFRALVCKAVDLAAKPTDDGKNTSCAALSQSIHYSGGTAMIGNVVAAKGNTDANQCQTQGLPVTCDGI